MKEQKRLRNWTEREEKVLDIMTEMSEYVLNNVTFEEERRKLIEYINKVMKKIMYK